MPRDEIGDQLADWGTVALLVTRGRSTGIPVAVAVGFVEEPDGSLLVAAGAPDADWAMNLEADGRCRVRIGTELRDCDATPLERTEHGDAIRRLILKYGTPAERLGLGPTFRLRPRDRAGQGGVP
jgi:deazaflavin-dependent oxidoreductase (nitroreductase family)